MRDYRGEKLVTHTGGLPGYVSRVTLVPNRKLGVTVLTNQESGAAFQAITLHILDHYLGAEPHDWLGGYGALIARRDAMVAAIESKAAAERDATSSPSLPLKSYSVTFKDVWHGAVSITLENGNLVMRFSHTHRR